MVQERVEGDNVRAFVLDGRILGAAEILTRSGEETDSRRGGGRVRRVELPAEAQRAATEAAALWGLSFAAVDFMFDERSKNHLVLECNSAPFFVEFERRTGLDVSGALADALLERRRR
jgi:glutathione synthase/RimK-type ligase-like ATP-grasp enzyme